MRKWYDVALITGCLVFLALSPGYVQVMALGLALVFLVDHVLSRKAP